MAFVTGVIGVSNDAKGKLFISNKFICWVDVKYIADPSPNENKLLNLEFDIYTEDPLKACEKSKFKHYMF